MVAFVVFLVLLAPALAAAEDRPGPSSSIPAAPSATAEPAERPALKLDSILRPRSTPTAKIGGEAVGGRNRTEWADAFAGIRLEIQELDGKLEISRKKLSASAAATGEYQYSPLGGGQSTDPETLKLRAQLKRDRESLDAARRRLRDLEVEASLSGVPREWFDAKENPATP
jgi:hypothetical protein